MAPEKTRQERIIEGIRILKKLREVGVHETDSGITQTKALIDEWIASGETVQGLVEFPRYGRRLELLLPRKGVATAAFKVVDEETRKALLRHN